MGLASFCPHPKVSLYPSGASYIAKAEQTKSAAGQVVVEMRHFNSPNQAPDQVYIERANSCDIDVGIYSTSRGSPVCDRPEVF